MVREYELREAEVAVDDAAGDRRRLAVHRSHSHTMDLAHGDTAQGRPDGPLRRIEVFEPWVAALAGLEQYQRIEVLYWLHLSRRNLVLQNPGQ